MVTPVLPAYAAVNTWQQKGVSYYPSSPTDFASDGYRQTVNQFKAMGANTVTLIVQLYQSNVNSTDIGSGGNTPTDDALVSGIQYAHAQGMQVMLDIHLDTYDGQWRAYINPSDRATWYAHYLAELKHYAQIAQANNVESYCLGTELIHMSSSAINSDNTQQWQNMIAQVRQLYTGKLTYDANWGPDQTVGEARYVQFWSSLDFIGISGYYPLSGDGSVAQNEAAWGNWNAQEIQPLNAKWNKPIIFTEIGYRSVSGAHQAPYDSGMGGSYDPQEQVNDYQALFDYWNKYAYMQGIDFWYAITNPQAGGSGNTDYLIQNKPVMQTFQTWFQGSGTATTTSGPPPAFKVSGSVNPTATSAGQQVTFTGTVADSGGPAWGANVDLEVYNASGKQVAQHVYDSQDFSAGQSRNYTLAYTPPDTGTYTLKLGVFDSAWKLYTWNDSVAQTNAGNSGSTGGGTTGGGTSGGGTTGSTTPGQVTDIWWPSDGSHVTGVQPFKALLENVSPVNYRMFWQVDGGQLNEMANSTTDYPHKEALVDLSGWKWNNGGPYTITFVSKDGSGAVLSQKSAKIYIGS